MHNKIIPFLLLIIFALANKTFASSGDQAYVLPYCDVSNPKTPPPDDEQPFFLARSISGNLLTQWCNEYNLLKNRRWASFSKEYDLSSLNNYSIIKFKVYTTKSKEKSDDKKGATTNRNIHGKKDLFDAMKFPREPKTYNEIEEHIYFSNFQRCFIKVMGKHLWDIDTCTSISNEEGMAYMNKFAR